jgi:glycine C-acetyltransferase
MSKAIYDFLKNELNHLEEQKLYKHERVIESPQGAEIIVDGKKVLNFCANNYLGLSNHPLIVKAAHKGLDERGFGLSSVRFICGTQDRHKVLEKKLSEFVGLDDAILFSSCFDANGAIFEALFQEQDAIITDALNHASIIDGIRLAKAHRWIYKHMDMGDVEEEDQATGKTAKGLERCLKEANAASVRFKVIVTDGVFSMDGEIAPLDEICELAQKYDALVMVDDSHATGIAGKGGRGTHEYKNCMDKVDIITTTFGKALGGASGGAIISRTPIIEWLRNKGRPYLFSNTVAPSVVEATIAALDFLNNSTELIDKLDRNVNIFRKSLIEAGFDLLPGVHPINAVMFRKYEDSSRKAVEFANRLFDEGIFAVAFSYPVVPKGKDRIRVQISATHELEHVHKAINAFIKVGKDMGLI